VFVIIVIDGSRIVFYVFLLGFLIIVCCVSSVLGWFDLLLV